MTAGALLALALLGAPGLANVPWIEHDRIAAVAVDDDAAAVGVNPAALAAGRGLSLEGSFGFGAYSGEISLRANAGLLGGLSFFQREDGRGRGYAWSRGFGSPGGLAWGLTYRWGEGTDPGQTTPGLDLGFLLRPGARLSLGATLWSPLDGLPGARAGLALRPLGSERFELFSDLVWRRSDDDLTHALGASAEPIIGVELRGAWENDDARVQLRLRGTHLALALMADRPEAGESSRPRDGSVLWRLDSRRSPRLFGRSGSQVAEIGIRGTIREERPERIWIPDSDQSSLHDLSQALDAALVDPEICAIYLDVGAFQMGLGAIQELRARLADASSLEGKPIVAGLRVPTRSGYYLSSVADLLILPPASTLELPGAAAEVLFFGGAFEQFGIEADFERIGPYKSAVESYTRQGMSDPFREQLESLLEDIDGKMLDDIASSRGMSADELEMAIDEGFIPAPVALERKLVDRLGDREVAIGAARRLAGRDSNDTETVDPATRRYAHRAWSTPDPVVAVLIAAGNMVQGESRDELISGTRLLGSHTIVDALAEARGDPSVAAVVLRVDSPGGSALAAGEIAREVDRLQASGKPVVVSVASVAASGGYYISARADRIVANPSCVIGSIGVYSGKFVLRGLYEKLGLRKERVDMGRNASFYSDFSPFTDAQRSLLRDSNERFYERFVNRVAEGRELSYEEVDAAGQGRIFSAETSLDLGLVDCIGGLDDALDQAAGLAGIAGFYRIEFLPEKRGLVELVREAGASTRLPDLSYWSNVENFRLLSPIALEMR
ncbi:MAG: signal peptide peptidase SppA [Gemmatimonadetes bacterium]|nr:signal peptide peptidase SppA [Gemmatimonadota bacterium]